MFKKSLKFGVDYIPCEYDDVELVDQTPNQTFNYNAHGYLRNEIAKLMSYHDEMAARSALDSLIEYKHSSNYNPELSDEDNLRLILPSKMQDPVEIAKVFDYQERIEKELFDGLVSKRNESDKISFVNSESENTDNSASS